MNLIVDFPQIPEDSTLNTQMPSTRRVSFTDKIEVKFIKNLSVEHKADLWFTDREVESFKFNNSALLMRKLSSMNMTMATFAEMNCGDTSAFMGLEIYLSKSTCKGVMDRRRSIRVAVLLEQSRQVAAGILDPVKMAKISETESALSQRRSQIIGLLHIDRE